MANNILKPMPMKRFTTTLLLLAIISSFTIAQATNPRQKDLSGNICIKGTLNAPYLQSDAGTPVIIRRVVKQNPTTQQNPGGILYAIDIKGIQYSMPASDAELITIPVPQSNEEFWKQIYFKGQMYTYYEQNGYRPDLRRQIEEESLEYLTQLEEIAYTDELTQLYVEGIFAKLTPKNLDPNRNENLHIRIIQSVEPDAFMLPNGAMIISSGLLCTLDSEDELAAILANEICHYALDHPIYNIYKAERRAKRSIFWTNLLAEAAHEAYEIGYWDGDNNAYAVSAMANLGSIVALLSFPASNHMGIEYKKSQEKQADQFTLELLQATGYNPDGLASALRKITNFYIREQRTKDIARYNSIDRLKDRLKDINGETTLEDERPYLRNTSYAVTFNAGMNFANKRYKDAIEIVNKNINNNLATEQDYIIYVKARMALENSESANQECMAFIEKAREMAGNTLNLDICKQNILLLIRMNKQVEAANELHQYLAYLSEYQAQEQPENEQEWIDKESAWAEETLLRINKI